MKFFRWITWIIFFVGIIVIIYGFTKSPFIPYQDPTPEMTNEFIAETEMSETIMTYGFWICIISLCIKTVIGLLRKRQIKNKKGYI